MKLIIDKKGNKWLLAEEAFTQSLPADAAGGYGWFEACREIKANYTDHFTGKQSLLEITEKTIDNFIKNFVANVRGLTLPNTNKPTIPLDFEHGEDPKYGMDAAGWVGELKKGKKKLADGKEVATLLVKPAEYTPKAQEAIRTGAKRFPSITFGDWENPETRQKYKDVLFACTLTNEPFVKGLAPILLTETLVAQARGTENQKKETKMKALREVLAKHITLAEDASDEAVVFQATRTIKSLSEINALMSEELKTEVAAKEKAVAESKSLKEKADKFELAEKEIAKTKLLTLAAGKISPAVEKDDKSWYNVMLSEGAYDRLALIVKDMPILFKGTAKTAEVDDEEAELAEIKGKKFETLTGAQKEKLTKKMMEKEKLTDYKKAADLAETAWDAIAAEENAEEKGDKK